MKPQFTPGQSVNVKVSADVTKYGSVQRVAENVVYVKHFNGSIVGYKPDLVKANVVSEQRQRSYGVGLSNELAAIQQILESRKSVEQIPVEMPAPGSMSDYVNDLDQLTEKKHLTAAELKKREEVAKAIERENPGMDMSKKMAIATATAKRVAEEALDEKLTDDAKKKIQTALGPKTPSNTMRKTSSSARAIIGLAKTNPDNIVKKEDMHYCAKHVFSERFGEGFVVEGSHAEPDENGLIEWYDVDFGGTVRRVMTEKVKVMHAEYHMNHKKKMKEEEDEDDEGEIEMDKEMENKKEVDEAKTHTTPKTAKEKTLAALAEPKDKITHADVMVGRGVKKEEAEQIDELSKKTLGSYVKAASDDRAWNSGVSSRSDAAGDDETSMQHHAKSHKRRAGIVKAVDRLAKENVEIQEAMISYSDFQSKLDAHRKAGNKIKDDKYDKNKASYTVVDQDGVGKKITHTPSGIKQDHLGQVEKVKDAETQTTEKRGRGRPAGSKSGARN